MSFTSIYASTYSATRNLGFDESYEVNTATATITGASQTNLTEAGVREPLSRIAHIIYKLNVLYNSPL